MKAVMIARELPTVPVLIGKDRYDAGDRAVRQLKRDTLILDDGFQRRKLARDLDIVTVDAIEPFGTGRLLPAGALREPVSALRRADLIILTRADMTESAGEIREAIANVVGNTPIIESRHAPTRLYHLGKGEEVDFGVLKGKKSVCGVWDRGSATRLPKRCVAMSRRALVYWRSRTIIDTRPPMPPKFNVKRRK